jgi:hypothetical protein
MQPPVRNRTNVLAPTGSQRQETASSGTELQKVSEGGLELTRATLHPTARSGAGRQPEAPSPDENRSLHHPATPQHSLPLANR